jgi:uncharacterized protein
MAWDDPGHSAHGLARDANGGPRVRTVLALAIGAALVLALLRLVGALDPVAGLGRPGGERPASVGTVADEDEYGAAGFVSFVLDDVQATWAEVFERKDLVYRDATLVLYRGSVASPCGTAPAAAGPFYCPDDGHVYLDLSSYDLERARRADPDDLAGAYVIAREIGHHVQNQIGTMGETRDAQQAHPHDATRLALALELQAACYAGVWAASAEARGVLAHGELDARGAEDRWDVGAALAAPDVAAMLGTPEQRLAWFRIGFATGEPTACDTFAGP